MGIETNPEGWTTPKKVQVILAHPDDPEFFCGASIARWCSLGHDVTYTLLTKGQRGTQDKSIGLSALADIRVKEQADAGARLGVKNIKYLNYLDGDLVPDLQLREAIVKEIRMSKPDIVVTCDPTNLFPSVTRINHPDHRAAGQAVLDAVFPAVANPGYRIIGDHLTNEPHKVEEVWLTLTKQPNFHIYLPAYLQVKIEAILCHHSQFTYTEAQLRDKMRDNFDVNPANGEIEYRESFLRIKFNS